MLYKRQALKPVSFLRCGTQHKLDATQNQEVKKFNFDIPWG